MNRRLTCLAAALLLSSCVVGTDNENPSRSLGGAPATSPPPSTRTRLAEHLGECTSAKAGIDSINQLVGARAVAMDAEDFFVVINGTAPQDVNTVTPMALAAINKRSGERRFIAAFKDNDLVATVPVGDQLFVSLAQTGDPGADDGIGGIYRVAKTGTGVSDPLRIYPFGYAELLSNDFIIGTDLFYQPKVGLSTGLFRARAADLVTLTAEVSVDSPILERRASDSRRPLAASPNGSALYVQGGRKARRLVYPQPWVDAAVVSSDSDPLEEVDPITPNQVESAAVTNNALYFLEDIAGSTTRTLRRRMNDGSALADLHFGVIGGAIAADPVHVYFVELDDSRDVKMLSRTLVSGGRPSTISESKPHGSIDVWRVDDECIFATTSEGLVAFKK